MNEAMREQLNDVLERCRQLYMHRPEQWKVRERWDWVSALLNPLYSSHPPAPDERRALMQVAFGGWCWREVEGGDRSPVASRVSKAASAAASAPDVPAAIRPSWAAWWFLEDGGDPAEGSPGSTPDARRAFFEAAADRFVETYAAGFDAETAREAFRRGAVLNDVERLAPLR